MIGKCWPPKTVSKMYEEIQKLDFCCSLMMTKFLTDLFNVDKIMAPQLKIGPDKWSWPWSNVGTHDDMQSVISSFSPCN